METVDKIKRTNVLHIIQLAFELSKKDVISSNEMYEIFTLIYHIRHDKNLIPILHQTISISHRRYIPDEYDEYDEYNKISDAMTDFLEKGHSYYYLAYKHPDGYYRMLGTPSGYFNLLDPKLCDRFIRNSDNRFIRN